MKKLIAIAVVFALVAGAAFAVDVSGTVFGTVNVLETSIQEGTDYDTTAGGAMGRVRLDASGEAGEGKFGGFIRLQFGNLPYYDYQDWYKWNPTNTAPGTNNKPHEANADFFLVNSVYAYWKPIDQFKLIIGNWDDGIWGKEGVTGWMFNQMPQSDNGIATNPGIWYGGGWGSSIYGGSAKPLHSRYTFFEGFNEYGAALEIKPMDMLGINIAIPFISRAGQEAKDVFKAVIAQVDLNLDFGNIAITFDGGGRAVTNFGDDGGIFAYFGGSFGDLALDIGLSYHFAEDADLAVPPLGFGVGLKYTSGSFGIKFKATAALGGDKSYKDFTFINTSILPYFAVNENICVFVNAGLGIMDNGHDSYTGFFVNPYVRVGAEWGPSFYVGIRLETEGLYNADQDAKINFVVPVALTVSF